MSGEKPKLENFNHKEAFCLMEYKCQKCGKTEIIWNSRDGVTPFSIQCTKCLSIDMYHVDWGKDVFNPGYFPKNGDKVFVDIPLEIFILKMKARIQLFWEHPDKLMRMKDRYESKEEVLKILLGEFREGQPYLLTL